MLAIVDFQTILYNNNIKPFDIKKVSQFCKENNLFLIEDCADALGAKYDGKMVGTFGMSDILGPLAYDKQGGGQFLGNGNNPRRSVSDATAQAIDKEVRDLVDDAHETALNILRNNLPLLESISQKILQEEVIEGEDLKTLLAESKMPA